MRYALAAIVLVIAAGGAWAAERQPSAADLLKAEQVADSDCRGSSDPYDIATKMECDRRSRLVGRLSQLGWCYGKRGQVGGDYRWHRCTTDSLTMNDLVPAAR